MPEKIWKYENEEISVVFVNSWKFSKNFPSEEKLIVNGEVLSSSRKGLKESFKESVSGNHTVTYSLNGKSYEITAVLGSKWPGIFTGCHIYVNGALVGGDTKSKLMFT